MKTNTTILLISVLLLASCGTYQGQGAATGAYFGSILGSAIGGISNGHRGSDVGTLVGLAGGAVVGAAVGKAADDQRTSDLQQYQAEKQRLAANRQARSAGSSSNSYYQQSDGYDYSGYDATNSGDDRIDIDFGATDNTGSEGVSASSLVSSSGKSQLEIRNARFIDSNSDNVISRGEQCEIAFEIFNTGTATAYNIEPYVSETSGNDHIMVSPNILVESLASGKGVKYTARVVGDRSLKNGSAQFVIGALLNGQEATSHISFSVATSKK